MLESNTFRVMLLMGGLGVFGAIVVLALMLPVVPIDAADKQGFELIMGKDIGDATAVTAYDALWYTVKGLIRGDISHY